MTPGNADRNLLLGILAYQNAFITKDQLLAGMQAWLYDKAKPLGEILRGQGALDEPSRALLDALVDRHVQQHGGDPQRSLQAVSSAGSVRRDLEGLPDPDLQASIGHLSLAKGDEDPYATTGVGTSTATGLRFRILRPHAKGGLGEVFVAQDEELHREVALKEIQNRHADNQESRARFMLEAEITGGLEHPGIVPVYGLGQYADGRPFYAMRFIRGDSLQDAIERFHKADVTGRNSGERALELRKLLGRFIDVCQAMQYAHDRGVLHRDLKPGNIMLGKYGETLIVDWGLAKATGNPEPEVQARDGVEPPLHPASGSGSAETVAGTAVGTPAFMSPEQAAGRLDLLGPASDVYSLGATLYALLTGVPAVGDKNIAEVLKKVCAGDFPRPHQRKPAIDLPLEAICLKAMALEPSQRYASPRELGDDIEHWLADEPISAYREPMTVRARRWGRKHKPMVAGAAALVVAAVPLLMILFLLSEGARVDLEKEQENTKLEQEKTQDALKLAETRRRNAEKLADANKSLANQEARARIEAVKLADANKQLAIKENAARLDADDRRKAAEALAVALKFENAFQQPDENRAFSILSAAELLRVVAMREDPLMHDSLRLHLGNWQAQVHQLKSCVVHTDTVLAICGSLDGKTILTGNKDGSARLWEAATGKPFGPPLQHPHAVRAVALSPDGKTALTASLKTARLWETATGKPLGDPMHHDGSVFVVAFSPNGKTVLTGSADRTARLWESATGKPFGQPLHHPEGVHLGAFRSDGKTMLTGSDTTARLWEISSGKPLGKPLQHLRLLVAAAFGPDGTTALTLSDDGSLRRWDTASGKPLGDPLRLLSFVLSARFSPDGMRLLTDSGDRSARVWETVTGKPIAQPLLHPYHVSAVAFSPDGKTLFTGSQDGTARAWQTAMGRPLGQPLPHPAEVVAVTLSPDGKSVLTVSDDQHLWHWDVATGKPRKILLPHPGEFSAVAFSPDGTTLVTGSTDKTARLWDTASGKPLAKPLQHLERVDAVAFSPDGKLLMTGTDGRARLWKTTTGQSFGPDFGQNFVVAGAVSPNAKTLLTGGIRLARLWDVPTGKPIEPPLRHQNEVGAVAFSPNGKHVLTGSRDTTARIWETVTGKALGPPLQHGLEVVAVAFSPDGNTVMTGSYDKTARLWETATGKALGPPMHHRDNVLAVAYSRDGKIALTASADRTARVWRAPRPVEGNPERLLLWAQVITGMELDQYGNTRVLDAAAWQQRRQRLQELGGPPDVD